MVSSKSTLQNSIPSERYPRAISITEMRATTRSAVSILVAVQAELGDGSVDWNALLPLVVGIVTRFFVMPAQPAEAEGEG